MRLLSMVKRKAEDEDVEQAARNAVDEFNRVVDTIRDLGIETLELEAKLLECIDALEGLSDEDFQPSCEVALKVAQEGMLRAKWILTAYDSASEAVEKSEQLIKDEYEGQALSEKMFQHLILSPSLELLREARICLKNGEFEKVHTLADRIRSLPKRVKQECEKNGETYQYCEKIAEDLREEGIATQEVEDILAMARAAFLNGTFSRVAELADLVEKKALELRERHRVAVRSLERARGAIATLVHTGARSRVADNLAAEAAQSIEDGDYIRCVSCSERVEPLVEDTIGQYTAIMEKIDLVRDELRLPKDLGTKTRQDIEEALGKAESGLRDGNYQDSEEDIDVALLMIGKYDLIS